MIRALYSAASGMTAQQINVDNIANNLANANTVGYKIAPRAVSGPAVPERGAARVRRPGSRPVVPTGLQVGLGTRASSNEIIFTQGNFSETDNPLDLVIQGNGFFQVQQPSGELAYTRAGQFQLDHDGQHRHLRRQSAAAADHHSRRTRSRSPSRQDGTVSYTLPNQTAAQQAGQIQLANFQNPAGLNSLGGNLYAPTDASGRARRGLARRPGRPGRGLAGIHRAVQRLGGRRSSST